MTLRPLDSAVKMNPSREGPIWSRRRGSATTQETGWGNVGLLRPVPHPGPGQGRPATAG